MTLLSSPVRSAAAVDASICYLEVLETGPLKWRSRLGHGRNYAGDYLHIAYRRETHQDVVFHMRAMSAREKRRYRNL
jgi:hypothetical protein